jgi:hypothetical protein
LTAMVPASLIATPGNASITVVNPVNVASAAVSFSISSPLPTITGLSPGSAMAGGAAFTLTVNGTGFLAGAAVRWNSTALATTFVNGTQLSAAVPASLITTPGSAGITVVNPGNVASTAASFPVNMPLPAFTLTGLAGTPVPTNPTTVGLTLSAAAPAAMTGTLTLSFRPSAAAVGDTYRDPAMQFAAGGTTLDFTVPAGAVSAALSQGGAIQQGTVAGDITVALSRLEMNGASVLPQAPPSRTVRVAALAPVITADSVRLTDVTDTGFAVVLTGYSTPRDLTAAVLTFSAASGAQLAGGTTVSVPIGPAARTWFDSDTGRSNGSRFALRITFGLTGDSRALGGVTVTLSNSVGDSVSVSGGR